MNIRLVVFLKFKSNSVSCIFICEIWLPDYCGTGAEPGSLLMTPRPGILTNEGRSEITSFGTGYWDCEPNLLAYGEGNRASEKGRGKLKAMEPEVVLAFCFAL